MQTWACLGGERPELLSRVEFHLWGLLFDVATGKCDMPTRLWRAIKDINDDWQEIPQQDLAWFSPCSKQYKPFPRFISLCSPIHNFCVRWGLWPRT